LASGVQYVVDGRRASHAPTSGALSGGAPFGASSAGTAEGPLGASPGTGAGRLGQAG
jgi:hypothetical protein